MAISNCGTFFLKSEYNTIYFAFCILQVRDSRRSETDDWHTGTSVTQSCTIVQDEEVFQPDEEEKTLVWNPRQWERPFRGIWAKRQGPWEGSQSCCVGRCGKAEGTRRKTWYQSTWQREQVSWIKPLAGCVTYSVTHPDVSLENLSIFHIAN